MILMDSCQVGESGRIGERSTRAWFVLKYLLGYPDVQSYNCSWTDRATWRGRQSKNDRPASSVRCAPLSLGLYVLQVEFRTR